MTQATDVECPACGRKPGEWCCTPAGVARPGNPHPSRKKVAKALREELHQQEADRPENLEPDWSKECEVCGATPIVPVTGMCGPCTFGEAETVGGNW